VKQEVCQKLETCYTRLHFKIMGKLSIFLFVLSFYTIVNAGKMDY
jgi:hypothetical protein